MQILLLGLTPALHAPDEQAHFDYVQHLAEHRTLPVCLQVGVAVLPDFGRSASSAGRLGGWGDVSAGANLKGFGKYSLGPIAWRSRRAARCVREES